MRSATPGGGLRVVGSARAAVLRRSGGACEGCGIEWPWLLYLFPVDAGAPAHATNLRALCGACSSDRTGAFAPLMVQPALRTRLLEANNRRTGATRLTPARRRRLVEARGGCCEICGVPGTARQLEVHHRLPVLRGGDDSEQNLLVLCFACHHHLQPCASGCGRWAKKPSRLCRHCHLRQRLERLYPEASWEEIKHRMPALALSWPPGYEPRRAGPRG